MSITLPSWVTDSLGSIHIDQDTNNRSFDIDFPWTLILPCALDALCKLDTLESLSLSGKHISTIVISKSEIEQLQSLGQLKYVSLHGALVDEEQLIALIKSQTNLKALDVRGLPFSEQAFKVLESLDLNLTSLALAWATPGNGHLYTPAPLPKDIISRLSRFEQLTELKVRGHVFTDDDAINNPYLTRMTSFDCSDTYITPKGLNSIASGKNLVALDCSNCRLDDKIANALAKNLSLQTLDLSGTQIGDKCIAAIKKLSNLRDIDLSNTQISNASIASLHSITSLENINISNKALSGSKVSTWVSQAKQLNTMKAIGIDFTPDDLTGLFHLQEIALSNEGSADFLNALSKFQGSVDLVMDKLPDQKFEFPPRLKSLTVYKDHSATQMHKLFNANALNSINISTNAEIFSDMPEHSLPSLKSIWAPFTALNDSGLRNIATCPQLEGLYISDTSVTTNGIQYLKNAKHLHTLELRNLDLSDAVIEVLLSLPSLHCLDLPGTGVSSSAVCQLENAPTLQSLALDASQLTSNSISHLTRCRSLFELYLYGNEFTLDQFSLLSKLPNLIELNLHNMSVSTDIAQTLLSCKRLRRIRLNANGDLHEFSGILRANNPDIHIT